MTTTPVLANMFANLPEQLSNEQFDELLVRSNVKVERIISHGHTTPKGKWYDQDWDEWVLLLQGEAVIGFENAEQITLKSGDYLLIPAHQKHRVDWTLPDAYTIWLAIHIHQQ